jgi:indole-3-glycerol phosphate synthase/phosphoribosylanthranilate isomerase
MVLDDILVHTREEVTRRKAGVTLDALLARCTSTNRSLAAALQRGHPGFILEIKFASPSAGVIRPGEDLEPVLASYGRHADAVSVLTNERFFGGSLGRLAKVRKRLTQPLLCKDFILEPFQVAEARVHGADAILLILAAIDDAAWRCCAALARTLGMEVLTEVHNAAEVARAVALGASIIGINNRDLRTLHVDLNTTPRLASMVPSDRIVVAESGIAGRDDVVSLRPHANAFLVGSALMGHPDLDLATRHLIYGRTKVCGLTRAADARAALESGATHGGLVFAAGSPRRVTLAQAEQVCRSAPLEWVGVFADQPLETIARVSAQLALAAVQLHGEEAPEYVAALRSRLPAGCAVWKAVRVKDRIPLLQETGADRLLLDGWSAGRLGGAGRPWDWSLLEHHAERTEVIVAGGLGADNVSGAAALGSWGLDLSSGVESEPGHKDPARLHEFFAARRRIPGRGDSRP